jgi:sulfite exporter TauE/SafE
MCGPIVLCLGTDRARVAAYNMGRLFAYAALGALAGALGNGALIALRERTWLSAASLAFMGLSLILIGARVWSKRPLHLPLPASLLRAQARAFRALQGRRLPRSLAVFLGGSLSIFLPCGHLYAFALGAAASGSAIKGILFMGFFWLGTVPALGLGAHGLRRLLKPGLAQGPRWAGALLVLAGLISVGAFATQLRGHGQATAPGAADGAPAAFVPRCH